MLGHSLQSFLVSVSIVSSLAKEAKKISEVDFLKDV